MKSHKFYLPHFGFYAAEFSNLKTKHKEEMCLRACMCEYQNRKRHRIERACLRVCVSVVYVLFFVPFFYLSIHKNLIMYIQINGLFFCSLLPSNFSFDFKLV